MTAFVAQVDEHVVERLRLHGFTFVRDALVVAVAFTFGMGVRFDGPVPPKDFSQFLTALPAVLLIYAFFIWRFGIHRRLWQYAGVSDLRAILHATFLGSLTIAVLDVGFRQERLIPISVVAMGGVLTLVGLTASRRWRDVIRLSTRATGEWERVLIVGAGQAGQLVASDLLSHPEQRRQAVAFLDDDPRKSRMRIHGVSVMGDVDHLPAVVHEQQVDVIAVAIPSASLPELDRILDLAQRTHARIQILPSRKEVMAGGTPMRLRDLNLDDLLDRDPGLVLEDPVVQETVGDRVVLVTGARGSIGFELCRQILRLNPVCVLALDNNETGLFYLQRELRSESNGALLKPVLADITEPNKLNQIFERYRPDVVFHAAAYKHVPMLEAYPEEAVFVNVAGTLNLCHTAVEHGCERFVFVSTDKAVQPVNVLGYSKRLGELIVRAHQTSRTTFCSVRFGNVVGSRGSALPEFVKQIDAGGPITVTHPDVERYFMTISEAVSLVIRAGAEATGGELFMLDMGKPIKIADLVHRMIRLRGLRVGKDIEVQYTGLRPGEKLTEELVFSGESICPANYPGIFRVDDEFRPDLAHLERAIALLVDVAGREDAHTLRALLAKLALNEGVPDPIHLSSVG